MYIHKKSIAEGLQAEQRFNTGPAANPVNVLLKIPPDSKVLPADVEKRNDSDRPATTKANVIPTETNLK